MTISEFIRDGVLRPRLSEFGCLVVYDPDKRFRDQCLELMKDGISVIDASESSIESREAALKILCDFGQHGVLNNGLLIYVPFKCAETDEQKQVDPFALYAECGAVFPRDDGDEYLSLCLRARPDYSTEIRQLFSSSSIAPSFSVIDAIGGGIGWPQLRTILRAESGREILAALLSPTNSQLEALKSQTAWDQEARDFLKATLGMTLKTRGKTWASLADELWRYILFSEFVFDLPFDLPDPLKGVPHAPIEARPIIEDVCNRLRSDQNLHTVYVERAEAIENDLNLDQICKGLNDLGETDTFPFEERVFLQSAIDGILNGNTDLTRKILTRQKNSIWINKGESQAQWELVRSGLTLIEACEDFERQLLDHSRSQLDLIDFYLGSLRELDRHQREFEQSVGDFLDHHDLMSKVISLARARYRRLIEKVQVVFMKHIETSGWPPTGRLANADTFDKLVASRLKESGHKVVYIMVDALRYELGVALEKLLSEDGPVELLAAYAQLPTITLVGMASLLPGAGSGLSLELEDDNLAPKIDGISVGNVSRRMETIRRCYGDRFDEMTLNDFVRNKPQIGKNIDLLVLRSTEIDSHLESNPETTLGLIPGTLKLIRVALDLLRKQGFKEAVIVTDHGFFLNAHAEAGDVCIKPQGSWPINAHDRMMFGNGVSDNHNLVINAEKLGVKGDFAQVALPRSMAPYRSGHLYFHGGASLSEAVVPVLVAKLDVDSQPGIRKPIVGLTYKNGAKKITTRLPVIEVTLTSDDIFSQGLHLEILLEAQDSKGNVVGEPRPGGDVNPATQTITLMQSQRKQIALRMDEDFRGKFTIKVLNPTTLAAYSNLALETDYTE